MTRTALVGALAGLLVVAGLACGGGETGEPGVGFVDAAGDGDGTADGTAPDATRDGDRGDGVDAAGDTTPPPVCEADGVVCDDGDPCTIDDRCEDGVCAGDRLTCDDDNPCTDDGCDPSAGGCIFVPNTAAACDDGDPCTTGDRCADGRCAGDADPACACLGDLDCLPFDDADRCNGRLTCQDGQCRTDPDTVVRCGEDPAPCRTAVCEPTTGTCRSTDEPDGTPCDDGTPCFVQSSCDDGECVGAPLDCGDDVPCTRDSCSNLSGCHHIPLHEICDDGDECTADTCDVLEGCVHEPAAEGLPCRQDSEMPGHCRGGSCVPDDGDPCPEDEDPCTINEPVTGAGGDVTCVVLPAPDGTPCDDGDPTTTGDGCDGGICVGEGAPTCEAMDCDDDNPCTDDACVDGRCVYTDNDDPCDDGIFCTANDRCEDGVCVGDAEDCAACTADFGDAVSKVTELAIGEDGREGNALDVDGDPGTCAPEGDCDGGRDNALADFAGLANPQLEAALASGDAVILLALPSWPPPAGSFDIEVFLAADPAPGAEGCDPLGAGCAYVVAPSQLDAACGAASRIRDVTYAARHLSGGGPGSRIVLTLSTPLTGTIRTPIQNVRIEADVQVVSQDEIRLTGVIAGAVPRSEPWVQTILPSLGIAPDLDLDGDGQAESVSVGLPFRGLPAVIAPRVCVPGYCFLTGAAGCLETVDCVQGCAENDDTCRLACFESATADAQQRYLALGTCIQERCPSQTVECIQASCWDELSACDQD